MSTGLHSLATIVRRLEAAISRLEDLADEGSASAAASNTPQIRDEPSPQSRGFQPAASPTPTPPPAASVPPPPPVAPIPPPPTVEKDPPTVVAFDEEIIEGKLDPFLQLTRSFAGASVIEQVALLEKEFADLRAVLVIATKCQKPDQKAFSDLLVTLQADIEAISRLKEANRKDRDWFTHLSTVAEGAPVVGWVTVDNKPGPYVAQIKDSTLFYGNRVIKEYKEKDAKHAEWVRAYTGLLEEVRQYIMKYHTTGLVWNPRGIPVAQYEPASQTAAAPPPPPPPPPPAAPPAPPAPTTSGASPAGGAAAVFAELNRGEEVTKGLRKVDKSEMTHKNPALRASGLVPSTTSSPVVVPKKPTKPSKPQALAGKKPAKLALEGSRWVVEYQENESGLTLEDIELSQTVNLYGCKNSTVILKGKVNAVTMVNCTKTSVLIESVISSVSVTNSPSFAIQITGSVPTIQLDSTDFGQIYLSKDCLGVEITTAKCSSINVSLPIADQEDGVFEEQAVPEMLKTLVKDGKLVTMVVEHVG